MINPKLGQELNKQINEEMFSAYLYLSMSAYFEQQGLKGFSNWFTIQAQEELTHAMKFYNYLHERSLGVILENIVKPKNTWKSPLDAFEDAYKHEQHITERINFLVDLSSEFKDHATKSFLNWFVDEQVEEENSVLEIIDQLKLIGDKGSGLFMLNKELGMRTITSS